MIQTMEASVGKENFVSNFTEFGAERARTEASWVTDLRRAGIDRFTALGLPTRTSEDWRHVSIDALKTTAFKLAVEDATNGVTQEQMSRLTFEGLACSRLVFVNGQYAEDLSTIGALPEGVRLMNLRAAIENEPDLVRPHLAQHAAFESHAFTALNTAFFSDGVFFHVPAGVAVLEPVHLIFITDGAEPIITHPRNLIILEDASQATLIEGYRSLGGEIYVTNAVTEIVVGAGSVLDHYKLQRESIQSYHLGLQQIVQGRDTRVSSELISLGGAYTRNESASLLDGEGGHCTLNGLYMARGRQVVDNQTRLVHAQPNCTSHEVYKGILDDDSKGIFNGRIRVEPDAQKTDAVQSNMNLLLSDGATAKAEPQLEIYADDVKCTHGATIGRLSEEQLFYLRTRGIPEPEARNLLTFAFANEVIGRIKIEAVRNEFEKLVYQRFRAVERSRETV